jgi:hypothetical protein
MKPTLKAPGTKRLKLKHDEPLSNVAFNFNLRRYSVGVRAVPGVVRPGGGRGVAPPGRPGA